jgi:hypothetical protein
VTESDLIAPGELLEGHPQRQFESMVRLRASAPFSAMMDFAVAMVLADAAEHGDAPDLAVDIQVITLLGLALYQAGLDQHAGTEGVSRVNFQPQHVDLLPASALLADPDRARALVSLRPGHPSYPDGRLHSAHALDADPKLHAGHGDQWEQLRQQAGELLSRIISAMQVPMLNGTIRAKLDSVLTDVHEWNTFGWYDDRFPIIDYPQP